MRKMLGKKNRKWQTRPQLYKGKFYYIRKILQACLVLGIIGIFFGTYYYFKTSDTLQIKNITVLGNLNHTTKDDIITLTRLKPQDKLITKTLSEIQINILKHPWIKQARIRRKYPDTLQIHVTERQAAAILFTNNFYLVDNTGFVFKIKENSDPANLPILTGFKEDFFNNYPKLAGSYFNRTLNLLNFLKQQPFYKNNTISEIHFDPVYGFTVYTKNNGLEIYYGRNNFEKKQSSLEKFKLSEHYHNKVLTRLDLDRPGRVVARMLSPEKNKTE